MITILTDHDIGSRYLKKYTQSVIEQAKKKFDVVVLECKELNKENVKNRIKKHGPSFIFFNGHGTSSSMMKNEDEELLGLNDKDCFSNSVTFARACDCLKELGKEAVKYGCKAFIGYKNEFWIAHLNEMESRPLQDPLAKPVIETSNIIAEELIKGKTVVEAVNKSHENVAKLISKIMFSDDPKALKN
ncbi:hypothetical protein HYY74_06850 [Candidatus Woesearchaeota archaeon]|nr:hypothetical protein [Candidatus Woesearchaeota archaeon]